jgi:hypothetical protein
MDDDFYRLDREGGREKILKATYTPKSYRKQTTGQSMLSGAKIFAAWVIIFTLIFGIAHLLDRKQGVVVKPAMSSRVIR